MYAWEIDETTSRLRGLQPQEWADTALAVLTFALALGATRLLPTLAFPLTMGALAVAYLALRAFWRHWELIDRLLLDRDAYQIRNVRLRAERSATTPLRWRAQMSPVALYLYELRRGEEVIATGHITQDEPLDIGDRITIAGREGIVRSIIPILGQNERRLVVQLLPLSEDP